MLKGLPKFHTLDIEYNGLGPFTVAGEVPFCATLATYTGMRGAMLTVSYDIDQNTTKRYRLKNLEPGDRLKFTYDGPSVDSGTSINSIETHDRPKAEFRLEEGFRLGFDVIDGDQSRRLSHPPGGGFNLMISNVPLDHARIGVHAGNEEESWTWQQQDLYAGDSFEIEIVATDWCDAFPKVERFVRQLGSEKSDSADQD